MELAGLEMGRSSLPRKTRNDRHPGVLPSRPGASSWIQVHLEKPATAAEADVQGVGFSGFRLRIKAFRGDVLAPE